MTTESPFDLFDLTGKVAVVTGGSRGIGRSIVLGYARAGADVVIASRKLDNCEAVAREVEETTGRRALAVGDARRPLGPVRRARRHRLPGVRALRSPRQQRGDVAALPDLASITEDYYDKVASVNLKGPFRLATQFGTRMAESDGGSIINVSTIGSLRASGLELVYGCAKAGLNALTIGLADSYGPKVRANCILPGAILTDIAEAWSPETRAGVGNLTALKRAGVADDFIGTALWLASDASSYVTGVLVRVDGGMYRQT